MQLNIPAAEHPRIRAAIHEAIAGKHAFELKHQLFRTNGTQGRTHSRAVSIFDDSDNIIEWFGTVSDVTRRKQVEADISDIRSHRHCYCGSARPSGSSTPRRMGSESAPTVALRCFCEH
jgi:hypothetical protein